VLRRVANAPDKFLPTKGLALPQYTLMSSIEPSYAYAMAAFQEENCVHQWHNKGHFLKLSENGGTLYFDFEYRL
jgi:hypothetical protein